MKEFRLFKRTYYNSVFIYLIIVIIVGSIWKPPHMNSYTAGMPEELVTDDDGKESTKGSLSNTYDLKLYFILVSKNVAGNAIV